MVSNAEIGRAILWDWQLSMSFEFCTRAYVSLQVSSVKMANEFQHSEDSDLLVAFAWSNILRNTKREHPGSTGKAWATD